MEMHPLDLAPITRHLRAMASSRLLVTAVHHIPVFETLQKGPLAMADLVLAASLFHDWPVETCQRLAQKFAAALLPGGELWVHDSLLKDALDVSLAVTDYSAVLFFATKGRCYGRREYREWFIGAGLLPTKKHIPTLMDYGLISAYKST